MATKSRPRSQPKQITIGPNIRINEVQHKKLLDHIKLRLLLGKEERDRHYERYANIDRQYSGFLHRDAEDRTRLQQQLNGKMVLPDINLELAAIQIDEELTYLMSVFAPETNLFNSTGPVKRQHNSQQFAQLLNEDSRRGQYFRHFALGIFAMLKYNLGGYVCEFVKEKGRILQKSNNPASPPEIKDGVVWEGNRIEAFDMYNTLYDPSVHPIDLCKDGNFFALVDVQTEHALMRMEMREEIINTDDVYKRLKDVRPAEFMYYKTKPDINQDFSLEGGQYASGRIVRTGNWYSRLNEMDKSKFTGNPSVAFERVRFYGWVRPDDFGLPGDEKMAIWCFTVLNDSEIVFARKLNNAHNLLPCVFGAPREDNLGTATKSYAEQLFPLQGFASYLINTHVKAVRKSLYGVTFYDKNFVSFDDQNLDVAGRVQITPYGQDKDIRKHIWNFNDAPPTDKTLDQVNGLYNLMQKFLPTDLTQQVANLERATIYQAAATVQGTNRRSYKNAMILNSQCFSILKLIMMWNIFQHREPVQMTDKNGQDVILNPADFINSKIEYDINDILKGVDKLLVIEGMKELINILIQRPDINQFYDMTALIDYWSSMLGDETDFTQFRQNDPIARITAQMTPEQKAMVAQALPQLLSQMSTQGQTGQAGQVQLPAGGGAV